MEKHSMLRFKENMNSSFQTYKMQEFKLLFFHKWVKMLQTQYFQTGLRATKERLSLMEFSFFTQWSTNLEEMKDNLKS